MLHTRKTFLLLLILIVSIGDRDDKIIEKCRRNLKISENHSPDIVVRLQTIELGDRLGASCTALANVPDLDASLAASIHIFGRIRDRDSTHDLPMAEGINLPRMTWYPLSAERIRWEGHRLHLALARHVEAVRAETSRKMRLVR